jgi:hypothetical protein
VWSVVVEVVEGVRVERDEGEAANVAVVLVEAVLDVVELVVDDVVRPGVVVDDECCAFFGN